MKIGISTGDYMILIKLDDHFPSCRFSRLYYIYAVHRRDKSILNGNALTLYEIEDSYVNNCEDWDMYWGSYDPCKI